MISAGILAIVVALVGGIILQPAFGVGVITGVVLCLAMSRVFLSEHSRIIEENEKLRRSLSEINERLIEESDEEKFGEAA